MMQLLAASAKFDIESFIKARIRIRSQTSGLDLKGPDPTGSGSGSATLLASLFFELLKWLQRMEKVINCYSV
jgi:hypothetical protein